MGVGVEDTINSLKHNLSSLNYTVICVKVTAIFPELNRKKSFEKVLIEAPIEARYKSYIEYGDAARNGFGDDSFFAATTIAAIMKERRSFSDKPPERIAYIISI